jgi:hypothetical protein
VSGSGSVSDSGSGSGSGSGSAKAYNRRSITLASSEKVFTARSS